MTVNVKPLNDESLMEFIRFCKSKIGYNKPPIVMVSDDHQKAQDLKAMASFLPDPEEPKIWVLRGKRVRADWYRSLAHELVHYGQLERGLELDGSDGSDVENEANGLAGVILREWGRSNPDIFSEP